MVKIGEINMRIWIALFYLMGIAGTASMEAAPQSAATSSQGAGTISGKVSMNEQAAPNIRILIQGNQDTSYAAVTDAEGKYTIDNVPFGLWQVILSAEGYIIRGNIAYYLATLSSTKAAAVINLNIMHKSILSGCVLDKDGKPMPGATVKLLHVGGYDFSDPGFAIKTISTDSKGEYRFEGDIEGLYRILAQKEPAGTATEQAYYPSASLPKDAHFITVTPGAVIPGLNIRVVNVPSGFTVQGRVFDAQSGAPLGIASLIYGTIDARSAARQINELIQTDNEGRFIVSGLKPGFYWIGIAHQGNSELFCRPEFFQITTRNVEGLEIKLNRGVTITGKISFQEADASDAAPERYRVYFYPKDITAGTKQILGDRLNASFSKNAIPGTDGRFELKGVPPGPGHLSVQGRMNESPASLFMRGNQILNINDFSATADIDDVIIVVGGGTGVIRGKAVKDPLDNSNDYLEVKVINRTASGSFYSRTGIIQPDGSYVIEKLPAGNYEVFVTRTVQRSIMSRATEIMKVNLGRGQALDIDLHVWPPRN